MNHSSLLAIQQSRRALGIAIFNDCQIEFTDVRHLSSNRDRANDSAVEFIRWILNRFQVNSAALEVLPDADHSRRADLNRLIVRTLRDDAIAIWQVRGTDLHAAFGMPAIKTREKLRSVCAGVWPIIGRDGERDLILDAAAAALYVQTERLFLI